MQEFSKDHEKLQLAKLHSIIKATKIGLWDIDIKQIDPADSSNEIHYADEFRKLLGYENESDFPNTFSSVADRIHPDDKDRMLNALKIHIADKTGDTPYDEEYRMLRNDGEYGYYRDTGDSIRDSDGVAVHFGGALQDVTEVRTTIQANELQLTKLGLMVESSRIGLWDMVISYDDPNNITNIFTYSHAYRQLLGYEDEFDFPNDFSSFIACLHPEDRDMVLHAFEAHLFDTTGNTPYNVEFRMLKKNGEFTYCHDLAGTFRDDDGNAVHISGALRDVTEARNLIIEAQKRAEAEAANQAKSSFLSMVSHEIRTPMNAILGITEILLNRQSLEPTVVDSLTKIHASGAMLLGIINDILDLSKIEAEKMELMIDEYDVASLLVDTAQLNMTRIGNKNIEFILEVDESMPCAAVGDELRVKQILNNVLSNAFKYTKEGTVKMTAGVGTDDVDEDDFIMVIEVSDTGLGMTKDQVKSLFDEYTRFNLETNRGTEGTGLGMSITGKLVHLMNGSISVESEPGEGSVFTINLPQKRTGTECLGAEVANNMRHFQGITTSQAKIELTERDPMPYGSVLIVDDVETNIFVARGHMEPYGLKMDSVNSGFAAIQKIEDGNVYDIVFMDHMMPKMDGFETTRRLRDLGYDHPIVALTANAVAGQAEIYLAGGFDDFIFKPIDVRELNAVLLRLIRDKQPTEVIEAARREAVSEEAGKDDSVYVAEVLIDPILAEIFVKDALKSLMFMESFMSNANIDESAVRDYVIHVHGLKSALANVGKRDMSALAATLEDMGRRGNTEGILADTPELINPLKAFIAELKQIEEPSGDAVDETASGMVYLRDRLFTLKEAFEEYDESTAETVLDELRQKAWSPPVKEILSKIAEFLLHSDFEEAANTLSEFLT